MHKELVICMVVIFAVIIVNSITQNYTEKSVELMDEKLEILKETLSEEEVKLVKAEEQMNDAMENWRHRYEILAYFIEHDELEKVETELTSLGAHIKVEEYEEGIAELEKSIFILNHIKEKARVDIKNIF